MLGFSGYRRRSVDFKICGESGVINLAEKTVSDGHPNWVNRNRMSGFSSSW
jgi:hypothetical protein